MDNELEQMQEVYSLITDFLVNYSFQLVGAVITLIVGILVARKISNSVLALMMKKDVDITLSQFIASIIRILIIVLVAIMALTKLGIPITPVMAIVGALSLGIGLALQGMLSNYSAGVSIIFTRPFVVGDTIEVQGVSGIVKEVKLAATILTNEDETHIMIPNKHIVGEIIHNSYADSMVELSIGIAYDSDPDFAIKKIEESLQALEGVSNDRKPNVGITEFGDSSINIGIRFWAKTECLYHTKYKANLTIFNTLVQNDIEIPFPQRYVHMVDDTQPST